MNRPHSYFAVTRARAAKRQAYLRDILPDSIGQLIEVSRSGNIFYRGVLTAEFLGDDTCSVVTNDDRVVYTSDRASLIRVFRGVFFPADYDDARTALDAHEARREAWQTGDDAAAAKAERALRPAPGAHRGRLNPAPSFYPAPAGMRP